MAEDYQYFLVTRSEYSYSTFKPGRICYCPSYKYNGLGSCRKLSVMVIGFYSHIDYPMEVERLQPVSRREAELLLALPEEQRLEALKKGLDSALDLKVGTDVWVQHQEQTCRGIIRFIGNITKPQKPRDLQGLFFGAELLGFDQGKGDTDGSYGGQLHFSCDKDCGVFTAFNRLTPVRPPPSPEPAPNPNLEPNRLIPVGPPTSPEPAPNPNLDQPMSFLSDLFPLDPPPGVFRPDSRPETLSSGQKSLSAELEPMVQDSRVQNQGPTKGLRSRSKSLKLDLSSEESNTEGKQKKKFKFIKPVFARRASETRPESRPESEDLIHVKFQTGLVQTRLDNVRTSPGLGPELRSKSEPKMTSRTGPEPPGGARLGSTAGLKAGDQVLFINEMEQTVKGTVVFIETSQEETMVYIAGNSGTSVVPLQGVAKLEPEAAPLDPDDLYMDPDSMAPPAVPRQDCSSLGLDSVVEIDLGNGCGFGTIRWIGFLPQIQHKMVGLELEEPRGVSDGTFRSHRCFVCPDKHALFVKLSSCRPDSRFRKEPANQSARISRDTANHNAGNMTEVFNYSSPLKKARAIHNSFSLDEAEPAPPLAVEQVERLLVGKMKGIQGHHNSCYMDSALFSLFSCSSVLDSLLFKRTSPEDAEVQRILLQDIVNPLRRDGFVEGRHVMKLRKQLQKHGFSQSFTTDEKDPEEFLTVLMYHILALDPLLKLCSGGKVQDSFYYQIFLDPNHGLVLPSVQQLLEHSFYSSGLKLSEVPSCLILQMPRFGKKFKMFDKIIPSLELDMTDLLQHGLKQCVLCGGGALLECSDCFLDSTFGSNGLKLFCDVCNRQVHAHPCRHGHHPALLEPALGYRLHGNRERLHLLAVLCIETSHYVSFVKYGPEREQWLFYDSMADREGEADGYNVPQVSLVPEVSQYLNMSLSELANQTPRDMKGVAKRLLCDAYLYLYQSPALQLYT